VKTIPAQLLADLKADATSLAFLWTIQMGNGEMIRGTEHDRDITIPTTGDSPVDIFAGTYYAVANVTAGDVSSNTDLSVDNLEVTGAFQGDTDADSPPRGNTVLDVTVDDIEAGLLDQAPVTVLVCNWMAPAHGYYIIKSGFLGTISRDSDGKYTTEVRGLTQLLSQTVIRTFTASCNVVEFGDARCKFNVTPHIITGTVAEPDTLQQLSVDLVQGSPPSGFSYVGGKLTFTSGANAGYFREVKLDPNANGGVVQFWDQFPNPMAPGDTFTLKPGCDRQPLTCGKIYRNILNIRAFGMYIPGLDSLTAGPTTTSELGS
jgi:uncharacterized phage protein (TIGR02218 family)